MTDSPSLVIADPSGVGIAICRALSTLPSSGMLAWHDTEALRAVTDELAPLGWDALLVDADNEPLSTAAMSHLAQIHGVPAALVIGVEGEEFLAETLGVATMAARHLPEIPVLVTGMLADRACREWAEVAAGLDLHPRAVSLDGLVDACAAVHRTGVAPHEGLEHGHHSTERIA